MQAWPGIAPIEVSPANSGNRGLSRYNTAMDASKWLEIVAPFYTAVGENLEALTRQAEIDPDLLRLKREEIADKFEDAKAGLARAADLGKKNAVADLSSRGLLSSTSKESAHKSIDDRAANELAKMHREYNRAIERISIIERSAGLQQSATVNADQKAVFISHAHADKDLVDRFVDLLVVGVGVRLDDIFCTSLEGMGVTAGENFVDFIEAQIQSPKLVLMVITTNYLKSKFCLCEMGAAWALSHKGIPLLVEPVGFEELDGVVTSTQAVKMSDPLAMSALKDVIAQRLKLSANTANWEKKRDAFIKTLGKPSSQEIPVIPAPPVSEQSHLTSSAPDRIARVISYLEVGMANMPAENCSLDIQRLFRLSLEKLELIYEDVVNLGLPRGQLREAILEVQNVSSPQALRMLNDLKWQANNAIKLLKEHHQFLLLDA